MTNFFLIRHGETDWNLAGRIQGATDIPLNETGRAQANVTGRSMLGRTWDLVVASPLSRAMETASIIAEVNGLPAPIPLAGLVERNYGEAEGLTGPELEAIYPGDTVVPGRESRVEVQNRVVAAIHELAKANPGKTSWWLLTVVSLGACFTSPLERPFSVKGSQTVQSTHFTTQMTV